MTTLESLFADHQGGHTDFQMDSFITVRSGGTLYGCYRQALRELWKRFRGLTDLRTRRNLLFVEIDQAAHEAETAASEFDRRKARITLNARRLSEIEMTKAIGDTEREFIRFYAQAVALRQALDIDDDHPLTAERRAMLDAEMWEHNVRAMLAVELLSNGRPSTSTIQMLQSFPADQRRPIAMSLATDAGRNALVEWYLGFNPRLPEPKALSRDEARRLLGCSEFSRLLGPSESSLQTDASSSIENDIPNDFEFVRSVPDERERRAESVGVS